MKRFISLMLIAVMAATQFFATVGCSKQKTSSKLETTQNTEITQPQQQPTYVNTSKDPADYDIPSSLSDGFNIVCLSYKTLEKTHFIKAFYSDDGNYYLILPSAVDLSNVALFFMVKNGSVKINGQSVDRQIMFFDFSKNNTLEFSLMDRVNKVKGDKKLIVQYSAVPFMYLDFDESLGTLKAMQSDKQKNTHAYGTMYLDSQDDSFDLVSYFDIHGHGNATWKADPKQKLPYNIKFTDDDNYDSGREVGPLGMRANSKWCLLSNSTDESLVRTRVAHYLGAQVGIDYAIQCEYVNLFLGSEYVGAYYLIEKPANIDDVLELEYATSDNMDGSWVIEFDNHRSSTNQFTLDGVMITVKSAIDGCKYNALRKYLGDVSKALRSPNGYNKTTGKYYYDYIDLESYAKFLLIREFCMDYDLVANQWAYYDAKEGKMNAGPLWDFDNSLWKCGGSRGHMSMYKDTDKLLVMQDDKQPGCWLVELMKHNEFTDALKKEYEKYSYLFDLNDPRCIFNVYEGWFEYMKPIVEQDDLRWNVLVDTQTIKGYEYDNSDYAPYFAKVANFLHDRCRDYESALEKYAKGK